MSGDIRFEAAKAIAEQIWREQTLSSNRMNWNLTFQGFMMAAFAVVAAADKQALTLAMIQLAICVSAFAVSGFTLSGINASIEQRKYLRDQFNELHAKAPPAAEGEPPEIRFPRPFAETKVSGRGRTVARGIPIVLMITWMLLALLTLPDGMRLMLPNG